MNEQCKLKLLKFVFQIHYNRPRMYLFTYAVDDDNTNEMYAEFHLGIEYIILGNAKYYHMHL